MRLTVDLALARRLERCEGTANARFVEARAALQPQSGAQWIEVAGAYAMFDGVDSPLTQTFGLGLFDAVTADHLAQIEEFFASRGAPVMHEISPLAPPELWPLLHQRGYYPFEFTSVLFQELAQRQPLPPDPRIQVRVVGGDEVELWARTATEGWSEFPDVVPLMLELSRITVARAGSRAYLAEIDGEAVGTGALAIDSGVAFLAGASTIPRARRQGVQRALLEARLAHGVAAGCDVAMMGALPGSQSQRNAEHHGFRLAFTRVKFRKG
jgi:GNAT superfamily N-acetyltransferase